MRLALKVVSVLGLLLFGWGGLVWRNYQNRPMFRNEFVVHGLPFYPLWRANPRFNGPSAILVDTKLNTVVFISLRKHELIDNCIPEALATGGAIFHVSTNRVVEIPRIRNTLFLVTSTEVSRCSLPEGEATKLYKWNLAEHDELKDDFLHIMQGGSKEKTTGNID